VYSGRIRKELKKYIKNGSIFRYRGNGEKLRITIPRIDLPRIVYGDNPGGVGRGPGKPGDVIGKDDDGKGNKGKNPGEGHQEGIDINIDMEEIFKALSEELALPDLQSKPNQTFDETKIKYNDISLVGPESLRHNRRTMQQAMKRLAAGGELNTLHTVPGCDTKIKLITPINRDRRYRQYKEIKIPSSNAVIFFARDGSGSMDQFKCDVVSDMAWWIDLWIRRFYKRTERVYVWHDTVAEEVDEAKFYKYRYGGGTICSSAFKYIVKQFVVRYKPEKWNIYVLYFSDGENFGEDNVVLNKIIHEKMTPNIVNFVGVTEIMDGGWGNSVKSSVDTFKHASNVRTTSIGKEVDGKLDQNYLAGGPINDVERDGQIKKAITDLFGKKPVANMAIKNDG
jgi:uncharacterized sporulation protein YeaH/YhbH (DUF444 family)